MTPSRPVVLFVTSSFPVGNAEAFLTDELRALEDTLEIALAPVRPISGASPQDDSLARRAMIEPVWSAGTLAAVALTLLRRPGFALWAFREALGREGARLRSLGAVPKALWLTRRCANAGVSHVHAYWASNPATVACIVARGLGVPWSLTAHRWDIYHAGSIARNSQDATFLRFISSRGARDAVALGVPEQKSYVIHLGIDLNGRRVVPTRSRHEPLRLACTANLQPVKGHEQLLRAVALIRRTRAVKLTLTGEGPERDRLLSLVDELGLQESVEFRGHVAHGSVLDELASGGVDISVLASRELAGNVHEGVPVSLLESMSFGIPVVATDTGSIGELLDRESGLLVDDCDPEAFADAVLALAEHPDAYARASSYCRSRVEERWSASRSASALVDLLTLPGACRSSDGAEGSGGGGDAHCHGDSVSKGC